MKAIGDHEYHGFRVIRHESWNGRLRGWRAVYGHRIGGRISASSSSQDLFGSVAACYAAIDDFITGVSALVARRQPAH